MTAPAAALSAATDAAAAAALFTTVVCAFLTATGVELYSLRRARMPCHFDSIAPTDASNPPSTPSRFFPARALASIWA